MTLPVRLYGRTPAQDFGPIALKAVREQMINEGRNRRTINGRFYMARRIFRWGVEHKLIPPSVNQGCKPSPVSGPERVPRQSPAMFSLSPLPTLVELLQRAGWVRRALFLADRVALVSGPPRSTASSSPAWTVLPPDATARLDPFDRAQLECVVRVCRGNRSMSDAGRQLFAASRSAKTSTNDADRIRKYLTPFGLSWTSIQRGNVLLPDTGTS